MANEIRNVFVSHIHEDDAGLSNLKGICERNGLQVKDSSINSNKPNMARDPDYIKTQILAPQIQWASVLVVYVTPETKTSEWVNWEIEYAAKIGKRIVGVWEQGSNDCELPEALDKFADAVVGWHGESIVDAITGKSNDSYSCDGKLRGYRSPKRYSC